jgi:hypothetical protein
MICANFVLGILYILYKYILQIYYPNICLKCSQSLYIFNGVNINYNCNSQSIYDVFRQILFVNKII